MDSLDDLHVCGICKSVFSDLKQFTEHKSSCFISGGQNADTVSFNSTDELLENDLICSERALDLAILASGGTFSFVFQCDNEEVISETSTIINNNESTNKTELENILKANQIDEEDVATLLVNQLPKKVIKNSKNSSKKKKLKSKKRSIQKDDGDNNLGYSSESIEQMNKDVLVEEQENTNKKQIVHTNKKQKHVCQVCNFGSTFQRDLVRHMRKHTGERPFVCVVCEKKFARQDKLVIHKRIHFGDKRYKCQLCDYACTDGGALRKHTQIHTDERPHKCQMCSYRARSSSHLVTHLRTHTGDSPFFCSVKNCGCVFKTSSDLKRHTTNHKTPNEKFSSNNDTKKSFSCKGCIEERKILNRHWSCPGCMDMKLKDTRRSKVRKKRGRRMNCKKTYKCSHCEAAFVREDSLRSHLRLHPQTSPPSSPDEKQQNNEAEGSKSPDLFSSTEANERVLTQLYGGSSANSLEESFIPLEQDIIVQSIMDTSFL